MTKSLPPEPKLRLLGLLLLIALLAVLAGLAACAGGTGTSPANQTQPPPPPPTNNVCSTTPFSAAPYTPNPQPNPFFGMHIHSTEPATPWPNTVVPTVQFGGIRLWDTGTGWAEINTSQGTCNFSHMDVWLQEAQANNVDVLYDLGRTPTWASSNPTDMTCSYSSSAMGGPGQCDPPLASDLDRNGNGADSIWIGWVTSVVSRYKGQIKYYEIWNEWNIGLFWTGTPQQLVRMTQDAYCVIEGPPEGGSCNSQSTFPSGTGLDPNARISTPAPVGAQSILTAVQSNMNTFLNQAQAGGAGPGSFVDVIGFHCYVSTKTPGDFPVPEDVLTVLSDLGQVSGVNGKPWFCTEGGWGQAALSGFLDPDLQAGYLARYYLLQNTLTDRVYWYAWDATVTDQGALWSLGDPTEAATAYGEVYNWITGATPTGPCSQVSGTTVYTCGFTRGSYQALAVWNCSANGSGSPSGTSCYPANAPLCYTAGAPTCSTFTIPSQYKLYRDLSGNEIDIPGATIPIGAKPILLETGPLP